MANAITLCASAKKSLSVRRAADVATVSEARFLLMSKTPAKPRRRRAELRQLIIDAGLEVLEELPATLGFEDLTYALVFRHVAETRGEKVFRSSVHERIWANQREFQLDVVAAAARRPTTATFESFASSAAEFLDGADLSTPNDRRYVAREVIRLGQNANWRTTYIDARYDLFRKIRQSASTLDPEDPELAVVAAALEEEKEARLELYGNLISFGMEQVGLRVRPAYRLMQPSAEARIAEGAAAVVSGFGFDLSADMIELPTGPNGELRDWYPASFGVWAYLSTMLELDDDDLNEADRRL